MAKDEKIEYKVLKKFGAFKKGDMIDEETDLASILEDGGPSAEEVLAQAVEAGFIALMGEVEDKPKGKVSKVVFTLHDINSKHRESTREFDEATHGEDFLKVADEFHKTNEKVVISRKHE